MTGMLCVCCAQSHENVTADIGDEWCQQCLKDGCQQPKLKGKLMGQLGSNNFKPIDTMLSAAFFSMHHLTPRDVDVIMAYYIEENFAKSYDRTLLAVVRMDNDLFMVIRAVRNSIDSRWTTLHARNAEVVFDSMEGAVSILSLLELKKLKLYVATNGVVIHKCSWCELVFSVNDQRNIFTVRVSNTLSADETLCDECIQHAHDMIQPILANARIRKPDPKKRRNIIV